MNKVQLRKINTQFFIWLILLIFLTIITMPILWVVLNSFKSNFEILNYPFSLPKTWTFDNIVEAWTLGNFGKYFINSAFITFMGMLIVVLVSCPVGYALAFMKFKGRSILFYLFLLGLTLPVQIIIIPIFFQLKSIGLVNTLWGVILVSVGLALPFCIFLMRNTFKDLPNEIRESAFIDGAGQWRTFISIMLPLAKPGLVAILIFTFMEIWNDFMLPLVLLLSDEKYTISLGLYFFQGEFATNNALIFGGTLISMIPSIIVYIIFQRQFIEGMAAGSVK